jgi:hypothetical protein
VARKINQCRKPGVLLKLDLTKAFDSISWSYLFDVLRHMGFGDKFLKWISLLLYTANTRILVNGEAGDKIHHARGLRQGDPTSPLLFVAGMEVITIIMARAVEAQLFGNLAGITSLQRISIFADDVVCFFRPDREEVEVIHALLLLFGEVSGLHVNYRMTRVNSTNVLNEGLRIGEIGRLMNSKVKLVEIDICQK